jgi:hypothetical protein
MKNTKTKCTCGCGTVLYITNLGDGDIEIGTEENGRRSSRHLTNPVALRREDLYKLLGVKPKIK